ncbi:Imm10 family immunity protein [Nonomuraea sediminis]|uniref:Imm10 family immunity protein n=1 Tax=Nonomuraea sediminis TaxID=2835864 RepID=UPI001BDCB717|nr:Imm10 family immunity protein [Nonomuraea sediminis]
MSQAPEGWQDVELDRLQLGTSHITTITFLMADGTRQAGHIDGLDDLYLGLKAADYDPGEGTWFRHKLQYSLHGSSYNATSHTFMRDSPFDEGRDLPSAAYAEELSRFPRRSKFVPPWMLARWPDDLPVPFAAEPSLSFMAARMVGRDDGPEVVTFGLAEEEDGTGRALIFMMSVDEPDDDYCIVREDQAGTTYGGVTECGLSSRRLRLCFTEEAAEELDVAPVVHIDLVVDDEGLELVRRSLREILMSGPVDQRPRVLKL